MLLGPAPVLGAEWEGAFSASSIQSEFDVDGKKFIVVVPKGDASSQEAAGAFEAALKETGVDMIMPGDALGDVSGMSDEKIVAKATAQPIDRVAIVRVFAGGKGKPAQAVVTVYDDSKEAVSALTVKPSEGGAEGEEEKASQGVSQEASEALSEVQEQAEADLETRKKKLMENFLGIEETEFVDANSGKTVLKRVNFYKGKYREEISDKQFYKLAADGKYLDEYKARKTRKTVLLAAGWPAGVGGALLGLYGGATESSALLYTGTGFWLAGSIAILWGANMTLHPIKMSEIRRITDHYNEDLKEELGLSDANFRSGSSSSPMKFNFGLNITPDGGYGAMRVRF